MNPEVPREPDKQSGKQEEHRKKKRRISSFLADLLKRERPKEAAETKQLADEEKLRSLDEHTRSEFFMEVAERFKRAGNRFLAAMRGGESVEQNREPMPEKSSRPEEDPGSQGEEVVEETSVLTRLQQLRRRLTEQFEATPEPEMVTPKPDAEALAPKSDNQNHPFEIDPTHQRATAVTGFVSPQIDVTGIEQQRRSLKEGQRQGLILGLVAGGLTVGLYQRHKRKRLERKLNKELIEKQHELEEQALKAAAERRALMRKQRELERKLAGGQEQETKVEEQAKIKERSPRRSQSEKSAEQSRSIKSEQIGVVEIKPEEAKAAALPIAEVGVVAVATGIQQMRIVKLETEVLPRSEAVGDKPASRADGAKLEPQETIEGRERLKTPVAAQSTQETEPSTTEPTIESPEAGSSPVAAPEALTAKPTKTKQAKTAQPQSSGGIDGGAPTVKPVFRQNREEATFLTDKLLGSTAKSKRSNSKTAIATLLTVVAILTLLVVFS